MPGMRPFGITATPVRQNRSDYKDVEIMRYIKDRSGKYDATEKIMISDPYVDGWEMYEAGVLLSEIHVSKDKVHKAVYEENKRLIFLGWRDARSTIKIEKAKAARNSI